LAILPTVENPIVFYAKALHTLEMQLFLRKGFVPVENAIIFYAKALHTLKAPLFFTKRFCTR